MIPQSQPHVILLTRPLAQSQRFAGLIRRQFGAVEVVISPAMEIRAIKASAPQEAFSAVIFTSQQGAEQAGLLGFPLPRHAYCVGERTAEAARQSGFHTTVLGGDAAGLVAALQELRPRGPLLHLHGVETRGDVAERLSSAGIATQSMAIYDQRPLPVSDAAKALLNQDRSVILPLFSPRTAQIIADQGPFRCLLWVVAISLAVAEAARELQPHRLETAQSPDGPGMLDALGKILRHPRT